MKPVSPERYDKRIDRIGAFEMSATLSAEQFEQVVDLAVDKLQEAERCAEASCFNAACAMVGIAVEAALIAQVWVFEQQVRADGLWRTEGRRKSVEKPLDGWTLNDLIEVAVGMNWLPTVRKDGTTPDESLDWEIGDAVRLIKWVRNTVAHPGMCVREVEVLTIGRSEFELVYGIARSVLDHSHATLQQFKQSD